MTLRRLAALQWIGLFAGAGMWAAGFIAGWGIAEAECGAGGARWGIENDPWQAMVMRSPRSRRSRPGRRDRRARCGRAG